MKKITLGFMFVFTLAFVVGAISISPTVVRAEDLSCTIETPDGRILDGTWINGVCQPNNAAISADLEINARPIGFFDRLTLAFTFNAEKKAQMLQDFSNRSFALAEKKLAEGKSAEASVFFKKSENYTLKAGVAASKIKNEEKRTTAQNSISITASNRTTALTAAKANVENPVAKEAIQNAIDRQVGVDASVKAGVSLTPPGLSAQGYVATTGEQGNDVNGRHIGQIKSVTSAGGSYSLVIDYVILDVCPPRNEGDKCLVNNNTMLRTFPIASNATVQTFNLNWEPVSISLQQFAHNFSTGANAPENTITNGTMYALNWITIENGVVVKITPQYLP